MYFCILNAVFQKHLSDLFNTPWLLTLMTCGSSLSKGKHATHILIFLARRAITCKSYKRCKSYKG